MISLRKISSIALVIFASLTTACETEKIIFDGPYFIRFTDSSITEKESHSPVIKVEVHNAGPAPATDVFINYTIAGSAREGFDYTINGTRGRVKIESGELFGYIELKLINNSNNILRSQDVVFTLQTIENNDAKRRVGQGVSQIGQICTVTIQDDCILGGDYYGLKSKSSVPIDDVTISSIDCENYVLSNWDIEVTDFPSVRSLNFTDNGDNTLTIPPQNDETLPEDEDAIDGFGVVNPVTRVITFTIRRVELDGQPTSTFELIPD